MSNRHIMTPGTAFGQTLATLSSRTERMEKRQRWQGAINGPIDISSSGWVLSSTEGYAYSDMDDAVEAGAWLVLVFCRWTDSGSTYGYDFSASATNLNGDVNLTSIGTVSIDDGTADPGRFRSVTFATRVVVSEPFRIKIATAGDASETATISSIYASTIAFPG